jgi:hypothetical protein
MKVGGAGNSSSRTGTGVLRVCFTVERVVMVESQGGGELVMVAVCACAHSKREKVESKSNRLRTRENT